MATIYSHRSVRKRALRNRRMVIVDIENVVGGAVMNVEQARDVRAICAAAGVGEAADHVVIGVSHISLLAAAIGWPTTRLVAKSGPDGADLALLGVLTEEQVEHRFDEVVIVSGDGIFTEAAVALAAAGLRVTVVALRDACSNRLRMAAHKTVYINTLASEIGDAA